MDSTPGNEIKVAIRVRPLLPKEQAAGMKSRWHCTDTMISQDSSQASSCSYVFDRVFNADISNRIVYEELALDIVKGAMIGFNGTLFTYGQSGSGKTYTIDALRTFAIKTAYDYIENCPAREFLMRVSYIELYNEKLMDLLSDENTTLTVREDNERNVYIDGLKEEIVKSQDHVKNVLSKGNARRTFAETKLNDRSSRAHCIFRLVIESRERDDPEHSSVYVSYLNLVDLAGSERAGESSGERLREGVSINLSLLTLSQVIRKLSGEQREFINYRDSKLTRILQNALEGNSKTAILCTVAPISVEETHSTLRFALNAKEVKTKPQQNEVLTDSAMLKKSQLEISSLKNKIKELEGKNSIQESDELQRQKEKWKNLIREVSSFLCVSSKAREDKRPDKKRRETVCVPQIYRTADVKVAASLIPSIIPKGRLFEPLQKNEDIPESPGSPVNDSVFAVPHPLDSPCTASQCSCRDMSFTAFEEAFVQESLIEKYKSQKRKCKTKFAAMNREIAKLKRKLRQRSGQFVTKRKRYEPNESLGPEFHSIVFDEEDENFETFEVPINEVTGAPVEGTENTFVGNDTMRSEIVDYKEELDSVRAQLESLTAKVVEMDKLKECSDRTIAELRARISRDEEEIQTLKASEEERTLLYKEESKRWDEKVKSLESEKSLLEILLESEKGLFEASTIDKLEVRNDQEEMLDILLEEEKVLLETSSVGNLEVRSDQEEMLRKERQDELLKEWEQVSKFKEELNEQVKGVESKWCLIGEERNRLNEEKDRLNEERNRFNEERDRIHAEWNNLEKAHNELRQEKEEHSKERESEGSIIERLHALQEENDHLRVNMKADRSLKRESKTFVHGITGHGLEMNGHEENVNKTDESNIWELEHKLHLEWENLKHAQEIFTQEKEAYELEKLEYNSQMKMDKKEMFGVSTQYREEEDQEKTQQVQNDLSQNNSFSMKQNVKIINDIDICIFEEERATLLKELESLKMYVSELNRRKDALDAEVENLHLKKNSKGSAECQLDRTELSENERLQEEWEMSKGQNEVDSKNVKLEEQEAVVENSVDKCLIHEKQIERLEKELKLLREAQWEKKNDKETLDVMATDRIDFYHVKDQRESLEDDKADCKEEKLYLIKQKNMLQKEWDKLEKHQAELSRQEENVETKIERLCMLEEEKEQFEEEKIMFEREMYNLRQAQKDLMKEQEAFRHTQLQNLNKLEQDCQESVGSRNRECSAVNDDNNLLERLYEFERAEKEITQEKEVFEHEQNKCQENKLLLVRNEDLYEEEFTRSFRREKKELHLDGVKIERNICNGHENSRETENGISTYIEDESGIVTDISRGNSTLCRTVQDSYEIMELSIHEERDNNSEESSYLIQAQNDISKEKFSQRQNEDVKIQIKSEKSQILLEKKLLQQSMDKVKRDEENLKRELELLQEKEECVQQSIEKLHTLQEKEEQLQVEKVQLCDEKIIFKMEKEMFQQEKESFNREKELFQGGNVALHEETDEAGFRRKLELLKEKKDVQQSIESLQEKEKLLQVEKEQLQVDKEQLQVEKEKLYGEIGIFQMEKETLQSEKELFQGENEDLRVEKNEENLRRELQLLKEKEECVQHAVEKIQEKEEQLQLEKVQLRDEKELFQFEKEMFQQEKETLCREKEMFQGEKEDLNKDRECIHEREDVEKIHDDLIKKVQTLSDDEQDVEDHVDRLCIQCKERFQNERVGFQLDHNLSRKQASSQTEREYIQEGENKLENIKKCCECLQQKYVIIMEDAKPLHGEKDKDEIELGETCQGDSKDLEKTHLNEQSSLDLEVNEQKYLEERAKMDSSHVVEKISTEREVCKSVSRERNGQPFDLLENAELTQVSVYEKDGRLDEEIEEEKKILQEEWKNLRMCQENLYREKISLVELEKDLQVRSEQLQMFDEEQKRLQQSLDDLKQIEENVKREQEKLKDQKDRIQTEIKQLQSLNQDKELLQADIEILDKEKSLFEKETERFCKEKELLHAEIERLNEGKSLFEKETEQFFKEKERLHTKIQRLEENSLLEKEIERFFKEKELLQAEMERHNEEKSLLEKEAEQFSKAKEMLQAEIEKNNEEKSLLEKETKSVFKEKEILRKKQTVFHEEKERFEQEKDILQDDEEKLCKEKELFQNMKIAFEDDEERHQKEIKLLQEKSTVIEEELKQQQKEKNIFEEEKAVLQEKQEKLEKDRDILLERQAFFEIEHEKYEKEIQKLQEEKVLLQEEKDRLHELEKNVQEMSENLKKAQDCFLRNREELCKKEQAVESRIEEAFIFEDERQKFEKKLDKLEKAQEDLEKGKISLNEREVSFEKEKKRLQMEWENVKESSLGLDQDRNALIEKEKHLQDEKERLQSAWKSLKQSQDDLKKEQDEISQKYAEIEDKMQAVLEIERNIFDKDGKYTNVQEAPEIQQSSSELKEQLHELEDELETADKKIEDLQNLITKGKAMLMEKIELAKQANDKAKEHEETIDVLTSKLKNLSSLLETKSEEIEKLKRVQENYKVVVREKDNLKKEIEELIKGRAGDNKYHAEIIRHLKLHHRDVQSAEASFLEQRDHSIQSDPSFDQMRRNIEFENAAKFLELTTLKKTVEEQQAQIKSLEAERAQLQADCKTLQLHVDNEAVRSEAMLSTANQTALAKRRIEEELVQLRKQILKGPNQSKNASSVDEATTQMLKNQLKEKDQLIDQLSKTIDLRNGKWNAIALRHKELIQENRNYQKTVVELQKENAEVVTLRTEYAELVKLREDSAELTRQRKEISEHKTTVLSNSEELKSLQKENTELRASLKKLQSELQEQKTKKVHQENHINPQHQSGSHENLQSQQQTHQSSNHPANQQSQVHALAYTSAGAVGSFAIVVKDREIRDLKKQLEAQSKILKERELNRSSSSQKSFGSEVKQLSEEQWQRRYLDSSRDQENQLPSHH